jgi:N-acetylmuramoyl-L-alanine amidase
VSWICQSLWWRCLVVAGCVGWSVCVGELTGAEASDGQRVVALQGDGIFRLLRRHGLDPEAYLPEFVRLNRAALGPGNMLIAGRTYELPGRVPVVIEPLFGSARERVLVLDRQLQGAVFYLMSGHGGPDPGGVAERDGHVLCEDEYAYDVVLRLGRRLLEHGATVHFIIRDPNDGIRDERYLKPDQDEVCYPNQPIPANQLERLQQRVAAVNSLARQDAGAAYRRCIEIHVDARRKSEDIDIFFYHQRGNDTGRRMAGTLLQTIRRKYQASQPGRGYQGFVSTRGLYTLNHIEVPVVFIELGNIHNPRDQVRLLEPNNRQAMANWLCDGILRDFRDPR